MSTMTARHVSRDLKQPVHALKDLLANRRWIKCDVPFPHVTARNVFTEEAYRRMESSYQELTKNQRGTYMAAHRYDAYGYNFAPGFSGPLAVFTSRAWNDLLAGLFDVAATGHVNCGLHHHDVGSANGFIHNDLNPGYFANYESPDGVVLTRPDVISYTLGETASADITPTETIRAVAMIYYLANPPWNRGDGGETGLYRHMDDSVETPAVAVPPINNSLVAFECTPYSYHSFVRNRVSPRNSVVMWIHRHKADVVNRWGEASIRYWREG